MTDTSHTLLISRQHWPLFVLNSVLSLSFDKINFSYMYIYLIYCKRIMFPQMVSKRRPSALAEYHAAH